jgi:site-specific recombinase XerD
MSGRMFFKFLQKKMIYPNIFEDVKTNKGSKRDHLTEEQVKVLLDSIERETVTGKRDFALIYLLFTTGLRIGEVANANIEDLSERTGKRVLFVTGKGHYDRKQDFVLLPDSTFTLRNHDLLQKHLYCSCHINA